jgi:cbb3-type cytochrome oxidase subunit 3
MNTTGFAIAGYVVIIGTLIAYIFSIFLRARKK